MNTKSDLKHLGNHGFSLVELMLIISIVGILAAFGSTKSKNMFRTPTDGQEIEDLKRAIQKVRNFAITAEGCGTVTVSANSIQTITYSKCGPPVSEPLPVVDYAFPHLTISSFSHGPKLNFVSGGSTDQAQPVTLSIQTSSGRNYELKIMPAIGAMRLRQN